MEQDIISNQNEYFWNDLSGNSLANSIGIEDLSSHSIKRFDDTYLTYYPYLLSYIRPERMSDKKVLEVGLGWGTVGQKIIEAGADYIGFDIAQNAVDMMKYRISIMGSSGIAIKGNILNNNFESESFDFIVSIGCFHHTGNILRCIDETYRILKPNGEAILMLYNQFSLRQWIKWPLKTFSNLFLGKQAVSEAQRKAYDTNTTGDSAPCTRFVSIGEIKTLFSKFSSIESKKENCDDLMILGRILINRAILLSYIGPLAGLDIYIQAIK